MKWQATLGFILLSSVLVAGQLALADTKPANAEYRSNTTGFAVQVAHKEKNNIKNGDTKFKNKSNNNRTKIKYSTGGPPPWAPAHGYRRKAGYYDNLGYRDYGLKAPPIDLALGRCNREIIGQVLGGGLGALAGSQIGSGSGRLVAVAAGTIVGVLVGGDVGRTMDRTDAHCVDQVLETAPDGETIVWNRDGQNYSVTPTSTTSGGDAGYCREYVAKSTIDGRPVQTYGTACRQPDGAWKIVS